MRILHTMIRVGNLTRSIEFYTNALGMSLLWQRDYPDGKFTLAFIGYGPEDTHPAIELTYNYGVETYEIGTGFGHIAIGVTDIQLACDRIRAAGGRITREPGPMKHGTSIIAFAVDPDGYKVELIEKK
jgi:lactoylglutathione lyase